MAHRFGFGFGIVDVGPVLRGVRAGPAETGERHAGLGQQRHPRVVGFELGQHERVHAAAVDQAAHLVAGITVTGDHEHPVLPACGLAHQRLQELHHDQVPGLQLVRRHEVAELHGAAGPQAAGPVMRVVAQLGDRLQHPGPGGRSHPPAVVQHVGDGLPPDASRAGDFLHRDSPLARG